MTSLQIASRCSLRHASSSDMVVTSREAVGPLHFVVCCKGRSGSYTTAPEVLRAMPLAWCAVVLQLHPMSYSHKRAAHLSPPRIFNSYSLTLSSQKPRENRNGKYEELWIQEDDLSLVWLCMPVYTMLPRLLSSSPAHFVSRVCVCCSVSLAAASEPSAMSPAMLVDH
jgi:hypothetical protein